MNEISVSPQLDPVRLHVRAANALSHVMRELHAPSTDYEALNQHLARAVEALGTLRIIDAHGLCTNQSI